MYLNVTHDLKKWIWNTALISKFKKNDRRSSRTPENAKFSNFTMLFADWTTKNAPRIITQVHSHCSAH